MVNFKLENSGLSHQSLDTFRFWRHFWLRTHALGFMEISPATKAFAQKGRDDDGTVWQKMWPELWRKKYNTDASSFLFFKAKLCNTSNSNKRRKLESSSFGLNAPKPPARKEITLFFIYYTQNPPPPLAL